MPSVEDCHRFLSEMKITQGVVDLIEIATHKQSESELWHALRHGRLTSSQAHQNYSCHKVTDNVLHW